MLTAFSEDPGEAAEESELLPALAQLSSAILSGKYLRRGILLHREGNIIQDKHAVYFFFFLKKKAKLEHSTQSEDH